MQIDYIDLTEEQITQLESEAVGPRAAAGIIILHGYQQGILTEKEALKQIGNIFVSLMETS